MPRLAALGHEIAVSAFYGHKGGMTTWQGHKVYPAGSHPYGGDVIGDHARHFGADVTVTLMDQWALPKQNLEGLTVAYWMPIDCQPISVRDYDGLKEGEKYTRKQLLLPFTGFGQRQLKEIGYDSFMVPHGIDCDLWRPPEDKQAAREAVGLEDRFVIFTDAANLSHDRKGYAEQMAAFSRFYQKHPEALWLIHSAQVTHQGLDLPMLAARMGCLAGVGFTDQYLYHAGMIRDETLRSSYGTANMYTGASLAEGFGLPQLQALACGLPTVTTRGTGHTGGAGAAGSAMHEICGPAAYEVKSEPYWRPGHDGWWDKPLIAELVKAYETIYAGGPKVTARIAKGREHALRYDVKRVLEEYWVPALKWIEGQL